MLHQHPKLKSLWEMQSSKGLLHQSPKLLLQLQSQNPREALGTYLLKRRTRPQCLKLLKKKKMILLF